jgi:hypothetical protein
MGDKPFSSAFINSKNSSLPPRETFFLNHGRGRAPKHKTDSTPLSTVIVKIAVLLPLSSEIFVNFCACLNIRQSGPVYGPQIEEEYSIIDR